MPDSNRVRKARLKCIGSFAGPCPGVSFAAPIDFSFLFKAHPCMETLRVTSVALASAAKGMTHIVPDCTSCPTHGFSSWLLASTAVGWLVWWGQWLWTKGESSLHKDDCLGFPCIHESSCTKELHALWSLQSATVVLVMWTERCLQSRCNWNDNQQTGFMWNRARRTEHLFVTMMIRVFNEQFQMEWTVYLSSPEWAHLSGHPFWWPWPKTQDSVSTNKRSAVGGALSWLQLSMRRQSMQKTWLEVSINLPNDDQRTDAFVRWKIDQGQIAACPMQCKSSSVIWGVDKWRKCQVGEWVSKHVSEGLRALEGGKGRLQRAHSLSSNLLPCCWLHIVTAVRMCTQRVQSALLLCDVTWCDAMRCAHLTPILVHTEINVVRGSWMLFSLTEDVCIFFLVTHLQHPKWVFSDRTGQSWRKQEVWWPFDI